jgi:hypothetical protein
LGALLLVAAWLKIYGFAAAPIAHTGVFSAPSVQFLVIALEVLLGLWLLSSKEQIGAWLVALIAFLAFSGASSYQGWIGQASCDCFGTVRVSPWYAFGVDLAAVGALVLARPDLTPVWKNRTRIAVTAASILGAYALLVGSLAVLAQYRYGSIEAAIAILRNERLSVRPALIDVGRGVPGEIRQASVELTNRTDHPIRVLGGTADCSCTVAGSLPVTVPPAGTESIAIAVRLPPSLGAFDRRATLTIDDHGFKTVAIRLTGRITESSDDKGGGEDN